MRIDDKCVGIEQHRVAIWSCVSRRLGSDEASGAGSVLDQCADAVGLADFVREQARQDIRCSARPERHHEPDRTVRLRDRSRT